VELRGSAALELFLQSWSSPKHALILRDMILLVKRCLAEISGQQHSENEPFCTVSQSELVRPLNTKNVSYNIVELLTKIWNFWVLVFQL
jgi:hypothetical protein